MPVATVSSKGQLTLPAALRRKVGIKPRDRVFVDATGNTITIKHVPDFFSLRGTAGRALSLEEEKRRMMKGVAAHVLEKSD